MEQNLVSSRVLRSVVYILKRGEFVNFKNMSSCEGARYYVVTVLVVCTKCSSSNTSEHDSSTPVTSLTLLDEFKLLNPANVEDNHKLLIVLQSGCIFCNLGTTRSSNAKNEVTWL